MAYTTINKSGDYFNTKLYTGNGSAGNGITGVGFQPDWTWIKNRDAAYWHQTFDAVRGASAGALYTNETSAEDYGGGNLLASFDSDGFTVNTNAGCNANGQNLVAWNWKANGAGSANTTGTINSTVSANTTAGFSIVTYTGNGTGGATVGHGLGVAPSMIIEKGRSVTDDWLIYHKSIGATKGLALNNTTAEAASSGYWNDTAPTSSLFTIGNNGKVNTNGGTHVAYCFAEKAGYSKFGSYTGTGDADGTFVYTGFKPAFILQKRTNSASTGWGIIDNTRSPFNVSQNMLLANSTAVEDTSSAPAVDFLSNGFKWRTADGWFNGGGDPHIFMAFAEAPLVGTNNIPATAR
jgi:hypothetical protein